VLESPFSGRPIFCAGLKVGVGAIAEVGVGGTAAGWQPTVTMKAHKINRRVRWFMERWRITVPPSIRLMHRNGT
jgi:hypothetical protein